MRRTLTVVSAFVFASALFAAPPTTEDRGAIPQPARHYILTPSRMLNEQEQADLASRGLTIERALVGGRYLVRIAADATMGSDDPRIANLEPLTAARKLHASAMRAIASGKPGVKLDVLFNDDVTFAQAKAAIESAGGSMAEPLQTAFHLPRRITVYIAAAAVSDLASDERVMLVYGPRRLKKAVDNATEAAIAHVTPLYTAPYNLSGQGVTLSYFELAKAYASHPEFQGRLTENNVTAGGAEDQIHATHTGGTMIAAGLSAEAKGMAPQATLEELDANADNWLDLKQSLGTNYNSVADNNSWGYILGWCNTGDCAGKWVWGGNELYYGGYDSQITATLDKVTRSNGVLFVHSAGNDATKVGPLNPPNVHSHYDNNNNIVDGYCYSTDGTGNDCPALSTQCKSGKDASGDPFCETTKHPQITEILPAPWVSVGITASAKNVITVGATDLSRKIAYFSSRGPTRDGRVKPDIVTDGVSVFSTETGGTYGTLDGTSMAAPQVTGTSALLVEQWKRLFGGQLPGPAVLKTLMIATADDLGNPGPDFTYGYGFLDAQAAVDTMVADGGQGRRIVQNTVATGQELDYPLTVSGTQNLRVVLGWFDPEVTSFPVDSGDPTDPLAAQTLVNDLDLSVVDASGNTVLPYVLDMHNPGNAAAHGANHVDNTEEVEIANATPGTYKVVVKGTAVTVASPQAFVLVSNADLGAAAQPCTEAPFGDTSSPANAYGNLAAGQTISARLCATSDVDYFKFLATKPGPLSVTVTATDTPLKVTLSSSATSDVVATVAPGTTQTLSTGFNGSTPVTFYVRIEPTQTVGSSGRYSVTPNFAATKARRRSVGRH